MKVTQKYHRVFCHGLGHPQSVASLGLFEPLPRVTSLNSNGTGTHKAWSWESEGQMKPVGLLPLAHLELSALVTGSSLHGQEAFPTGYLNPLLNPAEELTHTLFVTSDTVGGTL